MIARITNFLQNHCSESQKQWLWFITLWCVGLLSAFAIGGVIKAIMAL